MKFFRKQSISLLLLALAAACVDERQPSDYEKFFIAYGTVISAPERSLFVVLDDKDTMLLVAESAIPLEFFKDEMRLIIDYSILEKAAPGEPYHYRARVNQAMEIATVEVNIAGDNAGDDPIAVENYWLARGFLTFKYSVRGTTFKHAINLALLPPPREEEDDPNEPFVALELQHDATGDPNNDSLTDLISFPLYKVFPDATDPIRLRISYNDPEKAGGKTTIEITYYPRATT
ncbi:MAG: NigD-like protein [Odoribacteraceae bacterium]|jgi:hypothetical protein|nr:NigD-like protein [Odoribacteraceae bacterium]